MTKIETAALKLGRHRGNPRLWIEGGKLSRAGWKAKFTTFRRTMDPINQQVILTADPAGHFMVSGKGEKPIIDINCAGLACLGEDCTRVDVLFNQHIITVRPSKEV